MALIPDVPEEREIQLKRGRFLIETIIDQAHSIGSVGVTGQEGQGGEGGNVHARVQIPLGQHGHDHPHTDTATEINTVIDDRDDHYS